MADDFVPGYEALRVLGQGATGQVWLAVQSATKRRVAIKFLHRELRGDELLYERFLNEARAASRIRSRRLLEVYDFGEARGVPTSSSSTPRREP